MQHGQEKKFDAITDLSALSESSIPLPHPHHPPHPHNPSLILLLLLLLIIITIIIVIIIVYICMLLNAYLMPHLCLSADFQSQD